MSAAWEFDSGDGTWCAIDGGNVQTSSFVQSRFDDFKNSKGGPKREVTMGRKKYIVDFENMCMKEKDGTDWLPIRNGDREGHGKGGGKGHGKRHNNRNDKEHDNGKSNETKKTKPKEEDKGDKGKPGHPLRGLTVHFLANDLQKMLKDRGLTGEATIRDIEPKLIRSDLTTIKCPRDGRDGAAFVDSLSETQAGHATHMLSYTWGYRIGVIVDSLVMWCERNGHDPKDTIIWICCFCINQYRVIEKQKAGESVTFEAFKHEFDTRVRGIGKILCLMGSWEKSDYTTRVWCVFELYTALELQEGGSEDAFNMLLAPEEEDDFKETLVEGDGLGQVWKALSHIKVQDASAYSKDDQARILTLVREGPTYAKVNNEVVARLHRWFAEQSETIVRTMFSAARKDPALARACARVAEMLEKVSQYSKAMEMVEMGSQLFESTKSMDTLDGATLLRVKGSINRRMGDLEEAKSLYDRALTIHKKQKTDESAECAHLLQECGKLHGDMSELDNELKCHASAIKILEKLEMEKTYEGAGLYRSMGMVYFQQCDYDNALQYFEKAKALYDEIQCIETPDGAAALQSLADIISSMQPPKPEEALKLYMQALGISKQLGISKSRQGVMQRRRIANIYNTLGQNDEAKKFSTEANAVEKEFPKKSCKKDEGVYFELVNGTGYADTEKRGFPHEMCSFTTEMTSAITANDLELDFEDLNDNTAMTEGIEWTMDVEEVFSVDDDLKAIGEKLSGTVVGLASPAFPVNLDEDTRRAAGIPTNAKHFLFSYPVDMSDVPTEDYKNSEDPDLAFLVNGGFIYLDEKKKSIVRINAIMPSSTGALKFGPPQKWNGNWTSRLEKAGRFRPISLDALKEASNFTHFCWIRPNEAVWDENTGGVPICPYGGFAYIRHKELPKRGKRMRGALAFSDLGRR